MGAVLTGTRNLVDRIGTRARALLLFLWYATLCTLHITAVVTLFGSSTGPYTSAFVAVVLGAVGYFTVPILGIALFEGYVLHPVWPRLAFVTGDIVVGVFAGLTIGFGTSGSPTWPAIGNLVLASVMLLQCVEYVVIGVDARSWFEDADVNPL